MCPMDVLEAASFYPAGELENLLSILHGPKPLRLETYSRYSGLDPSKTLLGRIRRGWSCGMPAGVEPAATHLLVGMANVKPQATR